MSFILFLVIYISNNQTRIINSLIKINYQWYHIHYCDVIMGAMAFQITSPTIVYSTVYSVTDQRKHQNSASLAFVRGIHRWPVYFLHKYAVTRKMFPFDEVITIWFIPSPQFQLCLLVCVCMWGSICGDSLTLGIQSVSGWWGFFYIDLLTLEGTKTSYNVIIGSWMFLLSWISVRFFLDY